MADYNVWMNKQIYVAAGQLDDAARKADRGAFFGSIHQTLNHLLLVDRIWMARLAGGTVRFSTLRGLSKPAFVTLADEQHAAFADLRQARRALDEVIRDWTRELAPEHLDAQVAYSTSKGVERSFPIWVIAAHLFNHQTHHRGQITALLAQAGTAYGETDLVTCYHMSQLET